LTIANSSFWKGEFTNKNRTGLGYGKLVIAGGAIYEGCLDEDWN
jgi:hypothetical protein